MGYYWQSWNGNVPPNALLAGIDKDDGSIYIGRAFHLTDYIPAKVVKNHRLAYVAYDGEEHVKVNFEVLCIKDGSVSWSLKKEGEIETNAVVGGTDRNGRNIERLFIGRVFYDGTLTPGKIHPSHGVCYIPYNGKELRSRQYEILIIE